MFLFSFYSFSFTYPFFPQHLTVQLLQDRNQTDRMTMKRKRRLCSFVNVDENKLGGIQKRAPAQSVETSESESKKPPPSTLQKESSAMAAKSEVEGKSESKLSKQKKKPVPEKNTDKDSEIAKKKSYSFDDSETDAMMPKLKSK